MMGGIELHTFVVLAYKESEYLEECILSCLNQSRKSRVVIATSTPNDFIKDISNRYNIPLIINDSLKKGIANDFNFALHCVSSKLITIAHQDDVYDEKYSENVIEAYIKNRDSTILFSKYYELRNNDHIFMNMNLKIKNLLLSPLKIKKISGIKFIKRFVLSFGNPICCPSVCYVQNRMPKIVFYGNMKSNVDWLAWEKISKIDGKFIYIDKYLMGHRVHEESTTTYIINNGVRTQEDQLMLEMFWPRKIATIINRLYRKAENSNNDKYS